MDDGLNAARGLKNAVLAGLPFFILAAVFFWKGCH